METTYTHRTESGTVLRRKSVKALTHVRLFRDFYGNEAASWHTTAEHAWSAVHADRGDRVEPINGGTRETVTPVTSPAEPKA